MAPMTAALTEAPSGRLEVVRATCHVCGAPEAQGLPFRYAFKDRFLYGVRCLRCSLIFVEPQPTALEIAAMYDEAYFTNCTDTCGAHGPVAYMEMAQNSDRQRRAAAERLDALIRRRVSDRGRFLEVGCGPGFLLHEVRELGWSVHGLEISEYAVRHASDTLGLQVTRGDIADGIFEDGRFDAIFLGDVLEHLPDPLASLNLLKRWLRSDGVLAIAVPSTMNLASARLGLAIYRARGRFKTLRIPPYHLFEYTPRSLRGTLDAAGLRRVEIRQSAVPLRRMGLRGSPVENAGKVALQVMALLTSSLWNRGGDRLTAIASKG